MGKREEEMGKPKDTCEEAKNNKTAIRLGVGLGGAVGALAVWGGVAAIATLASVSAIRFMRKRPSSKIHRVPPPISSCEQSENSELINDRDEKGGLPVLVQDSSPPVDGLSSVDMCPTQIDSRVFTFAESSTLKKPTCLEILLSDNSKPESSPTVVDEKKIEPSGKLLDAVQVIQVMEDGKVSEARPHADELEEEEEVEEHDDEASMGEIVEEELETVLSNQFAVSEFVTEEKAVVNARFADQIKMDNVTQIEEGEYDRSGEGEKAIKTDQFAGETDLQSVEMQDEEEEDYENGGDNTEKEVAVEISQMNAQVAVAETLSGEDEDDNNEIAEKCEESCDGTGDSSMESNAEAVWPAESAEEIPLELKELKFIKKTLEDKIDDCVSKLKNEKNCGHPSIKNEDTDKGKIKSILAGINLSTDQSHKRILVWCSSAILAAALLLSPADIVKLCIIVFLVAILSLV